MVDSGHSVTFGTDAPVLEELAARGFATQRVGPSIAWAEEETRRRYPQLATLPPAELWRFGAAMYGEVLPAAVAASLAPILDGERPDLIVFDSGDFGAALAGGLRGIPVVRHAVGRGWPRPMRGGEDHPPPQFPDMARRLDMVWRRLGGHEPCVDAFAGQAYVETWPPGLRDPETERLPRRVFMRTGSPDRASDAPSNWVARPRSRPLVYLTLGTVVFPIHALRTVIDAFASVGVDGIVSTGRTGDPGALGALGDHVQVVDFVAPASIWPHVSAVVHHCGGGTTLEALAAGLPALGLPMGGDQFLNAEGLRRSGAGLVLEPEQITTATVALSIQQLLENSAFRTASQEIRERIRAMPAPADVVRQLQEMVERPGAAQGNR
ncbi:MAG: glycosyltransferase [Acidimicrobiales bacterium]